MKYEFNFGTVRSTRPKPAAGGAARFRIAILGDFSGRANRGELARGAELAKRKPIKLDIDNIEQVLQRFGTTLRLPVGADGGSVELKPASVDDLHPDALYENLELFEELAGFRQRLENSKTFKAAAKEVRNWLEERGLPRPPKPPRRSRGSAVRVDAKLGDFARLIGKATVTEAEATPVEELLRQVIGPYVVAADDPDQDALIAAVDLALSETMRAVLHHPDFQALEAAWRSLDFLVRRVETSSQLQLVLYDISAEELAADLSAAEALDESGLYQLLVEQPALDAQQGPLSVLIGHYTFEMTPPHAELLGRMATIAAEAGAPFIAAIGPDCIATKTEDLHPLVVESWGALRSLPEARFLALATPRFMLRMPYGAKTEPVDPFDFEEFDNKTGLRAFLWGNPAILAGVLIAEHYQQQGGKIALGKILSVGDLPFFYYTDGDGDQVALPCAERLLTEKKAAHVLGQNIIPVLSIKGRPEVRLGGFGAIGGGELAGPWTPPESIVRSKAPAPAPVAASPVAAPPPASAPAEAPAGGETAAGDDDLDLDALLADLDSTDAAPAAEAAAAGEEAPAEDADGDLDALLAQLGAEEEAAPAEEDEMDPELAALLADL